MVFFKTHPQENVENPTPITRDNDTTSCEKCVLCTADLRRILGPGTAEMTETDVV